MSKIWKNEIWLISVRKQNVSWYKPVTLKELNCSCFCHIINILLTELSRSVWKNLDLGRVYRPQCVRSVLSTSVKILPYRPPARLIRAKHQAHYEKSDWSRAFNQFTIACELDMVNAISAADIAFIMSNSTSAWLLSPLEFSSETKWLNAVFA